MSFYTGVFIFRQELVFVHKVFLNVGLRWCPIHTVSTTLSQFEPGGSILCIFPVREDFFSKKNLAIQFFQRCQLISVCGQKLLPNVNLTS